MSVIVKGMEMPESCSNCELCACYAESKGEVYRCDITMYPVRYFEKRMNNCPLVEVPPHGRLIDADAFDERVRVAGGMCEEELTDDFKDGIQTTLYMLGNQPTVIPADKDGES